MEIKRDIGDFNGEITALTYLGQTYRILRQFGESERCLITADSLTHSRRGSTLGWQIKYELAKVHEKKGDHDEAIKEYRKAIDLVENQRNMLQSEDFRIGFFKDKSFLYADAISLLYSQQRFGEAFELAERSRSRTFLDMLGSRFIKSLHRTAELQRLDSIDLLISEQEKEVSEKTGTQDLSLLLDARKKLMDKISRSGLEVSSLVTVTPFSIDSLQALISENQTILEYYIAPGFLYIFVVNRMTAHCVRVEISNFRMLAMVQNFRQELQNPRSQKHRASAKSLYRILIHPVIGSIQTDRLIMIPHEQLHYIPFAALMDESDRYLIDRFALTTLPSASLLRYIVQKRKKSGSDLAALSFLGLGNPDAPKFAWLQEAENEVRTIGDMFTLKEILTRDQATKGAFLNRGKNYDIIHFACHGVFDINEPLKSALILSGESEVKGNLTVKELFACPLPRTQMVVLSACETGLAKFIKGDELIGFSRAFIYAGTPSVLTSLWQVSDVSTAKLMIMLYKNLNMTDKPGSLRQAQLNLKSTKGYEHPFYWSAFQITGDYQ